MNSIKKTSLQNIFIILILLLATNLKGQPINVSDTIIKIEVPENAEEIHSPKKAAVYSAILPGLGQAYNKKYWKIPLVYAGFATLGYFIGWNNKNYKVLKLAYSDLTDGDPNTNSYLDLDAAKYYDLDNESERNQFENGLNKQQNYYRRNRDLLIISTAGFYALNIIDASVDAHLFDFDISEDLSFNWQPAMGSVDEQLVYGFNCTFNF
ncbi:MAG: DUF5683 domain-containing protein [Draconibacterium sp.]|nr:DUF5683 domain-containing protein [Draconibacterium sp.]